jgi:ParB-like chromosome segregation protein Spo0J
MATRRKSLIEQWASEHGVKLTEAIVPLDHLHPNPWNPNVMDDVTRQATNDSIAMFGFIDQPHVRPHPELTGHYQLLDGEHRVAEARALDYDTIPVIVLDVDTPTAMKLTVVMNQRGHNDDVRLAGTTGRKRSRSTPRRCST